MCRRVCVCTLLSGFWKQRAELRSSPKPKAAQSWVGLFVSCCTCEAYIYKINAVQIHTWGFTYGGAYIISAAREAIRDGAFVSERWPTSGRLLTHITHMREYDKRNRSSCTQTQSHTQTNAQNDAMHTQQFHHSRYNICDTLSRALMTQALALWLSQCAVCFGWCFCRCARYANRNCIYML